MAHPELSRESGKGSGTYGIQDMIAGEKQHCAMLKAFNACYSWRREQARNKSGQ
jgi:hypothetical protein